MSNKNGYDELDKDMVCDYLCPKMAGISCFLINTCSIHLKFLMIEFFLGIIIIIILSFLLYKFII